MSEPETADSEVDNNKGLKKIISKWKKAAKEIADVAATDRDAYVLEKATLEETISAWMTRALYAEKHVRALETALEGAKRNNDEPTTTQQVHDLDPSTGMKRSNANGTNPRKKKPRIEVDELSDDDDLGGDEEPLQPGQVDEATKIRKSRQTKERLNASAKDLAQAFLQSAWLDKKESFESNSSETFREYQLWCQHHNVTAIMKHRRFNQFMHQFMPNGFTVGRGSANRAVVSFNYELAAEDVATNMKAAEEQAAAKKKRKNKKE
jgi:hypothetical protein